MTKGFKQSKFSKVIACLIIAVMVLTAVPANYAFADTDAHGVDREWYNFRNNQENNGVTDRTTPTSIDETAMKWGEKYGTGWAAAPTPPLILNGKVYIGMGNKVLELDKETGKKLRESDAMAANVGFAMNPILYADGGLFVQVGNGIIQKIDLDTLTVSWQTAKVGGQTLCPISHVTVDGTGYIYTGTWNRENADGRYMCFTTDDEGVTTDENGKKIKAATWQFVPSGSTKDTETITYDKELNATLETEGNVAKRGFYWAGCYATEKYIAVGSDDGTSEGDYSANAVFYTLNPVTGEVIDRIDQIKGDIRTTTVYNNGYLYFSTKGGHMYKVSVDADGNLGEPSYIDLGGMTTAAPLVYKNKIYIGVCGPGGQFDPDGGHSFAVVDNSGALSQDSKLYSLPIKGYPQASALLSTAYEDEDFDGDGNADGRVYIYFTYNAKPGGIYYTYDTPEQTEAADTSAELFIPSQDKQQYCISTICADYDGTLYYKNDSCYLMAVETNPAYIKDIKVTADDKNSISWDQSFQSRLTEYNLVAQDTAKSVDLEITAADGATVEVDGKAYKDKATVTLNGAESKAVSVVAKKDGKQRTYTLNIRTAAAIATLSDLQVNTSNTYGGSKISLSPEFKSDVMSYDADVTDITGRTFYNVWPDATDSKATVEVIAGANNRDYAEGEVIEQTSSNAGHARYAIYPADVTKSETIQIKVTSENGKKTETYKLRLLRRVDVTGISLNETEKTLMAGETLQLTANLEPEDATNKEVTWSSLDEKVATVDENGMVTAVGSGKTNISAVSVSGSKTATCEITVKTFDDLIAESKAELDAYVKELSKDGYRPAEQTVVDSIVEDAGKAFDQAKTEEDLATVLSKAKADLDTVKTDKELTAEEVQDAIAKIDAIGEVTLQSGKTIDAARDAYDKVPESAKTQVTNYDTLTAAEAKYKQLLDEQDAAFKKAKEDAKADLSAYLQEKNLNNYRDEQKAELKAIIADAEKTIDKAETTEDVDAAVKAAKVEMDKVKTDAQLTEEETTVFVTSGTNTAGQPKLTWTAVKGASKYEVYRSGYSNGTYSKMFTTANTSYTNTSAKGGYTYFYVVKALDENGKVIAESDIIKQKCEVVAKDTITVKSGNNESGKPKLTWNTVKGAVKYEIYRSGYSNGTYTKMYTTSKNSYINTSAGAGYTYYYGVQALDKDGKVIAKSKTVKQLCCLEKPEVDKGNSGAGKPMLTWEKVNGADKYVIYRSGYSNGTYTKMYTTTKTSYTNTSAKAGYTYYYKVVAISEKNQNANATSEIIGQKCLTGGLEVTKGNASSGKPRLTWEKVDGAVKYEIYRSGYSNGTYTKMFTTTGTSYTNTSAKAGYTYFYKVKAIREDGFVESSIISVKCK
ncbi:MAG: Ig-like domain-containing protein [Emergencia sp.]|nr:Ig-like domain-containing protein [Emergencia sp.]